MGRTTATATITGPNGSKTFEFLVDTGSAYVGLPEEEIQELGLVSIPNGRRRFRTAEGVVTLDTYNAFGELGGQGFAVVVTKFSTPVIGYLLLEDLLLKVNPNTGALEPHDNAQLGHIVF
jgi:predicted aspartyl protease